MSRIKGKNWKLAFLFPRFTNLIGNWLSVSLGSQSSNHFLLDFYPVSIVNLTQIQPTCIIA